jgi:ribose/xylose/arabinose/galactoside ABC-type transport system permease subunit
MTLIKSADNAAHDLSDRRRRPMWQRLLLSEYLVLLLSGIYFLAMIPIVPEIASASILNNILSDMLPLLVVAIGQTFVLIIAGIDLSLTSIIAMASVVGASVMTGTNGPLAGSPYASIAGIAVMIAVGAAIGWLNGVCVTRLTMPPFMVTLTTMMFFSGTAVWYVTLRSETTSIANLPRGFVAIGQGDLYGIPNAFWVAAALAIASHLLLTRTVFGRHLFAIGSNRRAAEVSGVPVNRRILMTFVFSGVCAAIGSILYTGRLETGTPILGSNILLDIVGAAVIGGTSLFGGKGKVIWTVFGVLFLVLIDTSLKLMGLTLFSVFAIKGGVILAAAVIDATRARLAMR